MRKVWARIVSRFKEDEKVRKGWEIKAFGLVSS